MKSTPFSNNFPEAKIHENGQVYSDFPITIDNSEYAQPISTVLLVDGSDGGAPVVSYDQEKVNTVMSCVRAWKNSKNGKSLSDLAEIFMNTPEFAKERNRIYKDFKSITNDPRPDLEACVVSALNGDVYVPKALLNVFYRYSTQINLANEKEAEDEMGM